MKSSLRLLALSIFFMTVSVQTASATNMADVVKAQAILTKVIEFTAKHQAYAGNVQAPKPLTNGKGRYFAPYNENGQITEWATKTLSTQLGAAIGAKAGEEAGKQVAARVPFGGLASGLMKKKGKELGAVAAIGGTDFIKKTSTLSFNSLDDLSVYLQVKHSASGDFAQALAAAMAIYPELESGYDSAVRAAYQKAEKAQAAK